MEALWKILETGDLVEALRRKDQINSCLKLEACFDRTSVDSLFGDHPWRIDNLKALMRIPIMPSAIIDSDHVY